MSKDKSIRDKLVEILRNIPIDEVVDVDHKRISSIRIAKAIEAGMVESKVLDCDPCPHYTCRGCCDENVVCPTIKGFIVEGE